MTDNNHDPTTALTTVEQGEVLAAPARIPFEQDVENLGRAMVASRFFKDTQSASQAIVKILAGREMGFGPVASMTGIHIFEGKVAMGANLIAAAVKRSGRYNYRVREQSPEACRIEFFEHGESVGISEFTMDDTQRAKLAHKPVWQQYPRNMLFARALTNGARWYCADVFGGAVYTPEELEHDEPRPYIVQSAQIDNQTEPEAPAPAAQATDTAPPQPAYPPPAVETTNGGVIGVRVTPREAQDDDEPPSAQDATLAADLDAAFTAQAPKVAPRFPNTSQGQAAFLAECKNNLGLEPPDMKAALGGTVAQYIRVNKVGLDEVYAVLVDKAMDNTPVPGRLDATAEVAP